MNILLDTHVALWTITDHPKLSRKARDLIMAPHSHIWISAVSLWEISIKHSLGKGNMPLSGKQALDYFNQAGYRLLAIKPEHAAAVEDLELHHHDPFDRLLVAQALHEPMRLLTHDQMLSKYSDMIILV